MKNLITLAIVIVTTASLTAQKINWISMDAALEAQKADPRPIFIDMYTEWCGPCKMLDRNTFQNSDVAAYINKHYYAVKFNAEGNEDVVYKGQSFTNPSYDPAKAKRRNSQHQLTRHLGVRAYPTIVFMDEAGDLLTNVKGYRTPQQLELYIKIFANGDYKKFKTQEEFSTYSNNFKPQFKG